MHSGGGHTDTVGCTRPRHTVAVSLAEATDNGGYPARGYGGDMEMGRAGYEAAGVGVGAGARPSSVPEDQPLGTYDSRLVMTTCPSVVVPAVLPMEDLLRLPQ
jgi:hypothetical protein